MVDVSTLCRRCGLCCDGTIFNSVPVTDAEAGRLREGGLVVITKADGASALRQSCAALADAGCGVYAQRPGRCRDYRCMLLVACTDGEVSLAEAEGVVDEARRRIAGGLPDARAFIGRHFDRRIGREG